MRNEETCTIDKLGSLCTHFRTAIHLLVETFCASVSLYNPAAAADVLQSKCGFPPLFNLQHTHTQPLFLRHSN